MSHVRRRATVLTAIAICLGTVSTGGAARAGDLPNLTFGSSIYGIVRNHCTELVMGFEVVNHGPVDLDRFDIRIGIDYSDFEDVTDTMRFKFSMAAGESGFTRFVVPYNGTYTLIGITLDPFNRVAESSEDDNTNGESWDTC